MDTTKTDAGPVSGLAGTPVDDGHFRPDIEGLRAIAIGAVILAHVSIPGITGGFIGVDVFFVISGFLITGLLLRELDRDRRVDFLAFYARRVRRLLPAALLAIGVVVTAAAVLLTAPARGEVGLDGAAASIYVSNIRLMREVFPGLVPPAQHPLVFHHFWSLSVEEQFYVLWPLILVVGARLLGRGRLVWVVAVLGLVSFVACMVITQRYFAIAFTSYPTRAWELALGGVLAFVPLAAWQRIPIVVLRVAGWIGLAQIAGATLILQATPAPYPNLSALVPTVGAALVIAGGSRGSASVAGVSYWLGSAVPRWFGRISYSLYLWHMPLILFVPAVFGYTNLGLRAAAVALAVFVAWVSTEVVERRFRLTGGSDDRPRLTIAAGLAASAAVALLCVAVWKW